MHTFYKKPKEQIELFINNELTNYEPNSKSLGVYSILNFHFLEIKKATSEQNKCIADS